MVNTGYKQKLFWGCESTYGVAGTIDEPVGLVQSVNPTEKNNLFKIRTLGGSRDYSNIVPGKFEISGSFEYYLQEGALLRQAFGEDSGSTATTDSGPKVHTGTSFLHVLGSATSPGVNSFPSFSLEFTDYEDSTGTYNLKRVFTGARVNTLSINATVDEPVKCTVDWIAQGVTVSTADATSVSESTKDPFVFYQGQVYCTSGAVTGYTQPGTGNEIAEVNSIDFSINNNLEAVWYISGTTATHQTLRGLKALVPKGRDYEARLGLHFANKAMYQRFLGSNTATASQSSLSKYQIALDFVRSGTIGATPKLETDNWMRLVLGSCAFEDINITGAPEDIVAQNITVSVESAKLYFVDTDASWA